MQIHIYIIFAETIQHTPLPSEKGTVEKVSTTLTLKMKSQDQIPLSIFCSRSTPHAPADVMNKNPLSQP